MASERKGIRAASGHISKLPVSRSRLRNLHREVGFASLGELLDVLCLLEDPVRPRRRPGGKLQGTDQDGRRVLSAEQEKEVVRAMRDGMSNAEAGATFGVSVAKLNRLRAKAAIIKRPRFSPEKRLAVIEAFRSGATLEEVQEKFGVSRAAAYRLRKAAQ